MVSNLCLIVNCSTENHLYYFLPSYLNMDPGYKHDLIVVHRNEQFIDKTKFINNNGKIIFENKIISDDYEVPNRGNGSFKYYYNKYKDNYDVFCFAIETVVIRRHNWIMDAMNILNYSNYIGFCCSQIFNGNDLNTLSTNYPHPTHIRTSGPNFIKTSYLNRIPWKFSSDHEGEMIFGEQLSQIENCVGVQIGNKINYGYDTLGNPTLLPLQKAITRSNYNHIAQLVENLYFPEKNNIMKFNVEEYSFFEELYDQLTKDNNVFEEHTVISPYAHIGKQRVFFDFQPFNNLIYGKCVLTAIKLFGKDRVKRYGNCYVLHI
jgi:hypothetical protein